MKTSTASTLPLWKVTDLGKGKIGIQCPRSECGGKAVVSGRKWLNAKPEIGRACTYCFKTGRVPGTGEG